MSYGEYATGEVANAGVNGGANSAFAGATNLNLAPLPEDVSVDAGADYVHLHAGNGVEVPMGLEMSLPAVSNGATGASLSFGVDNGGGEAVASLQAQVNGTWQELSSSLVVGGGVVQLEVLDWWLPAGTPLKVVAFTNAGVDMGVIELVYYTVTKAVQTYMALSCDTDSHWSDPTRGFNGQARMDELAGKGNWYTATYWEYNAPLGRRMNLDPVDQIGISNYAVNRLNPIVFSDPNGDQAREEKNGEADRKDLPEVVIREKAPEWLRKQREAEATRANGRTFGGSGDYNVVHAGIIGIGANEYNRQKAAWMERGAMGFFYFGATPIIAVAAAEAGVTIGAAGEFLEMASNLKELYDNNSTVSVAMSANSGFFLTKSGELSNGNYTVSQEAMKKHVMGGISGRSVFYPTLNANELVLKAAQFADEAGLWNYNAGTKAKIRVTNTNIGTTGLGKPTNIINIYRKPNGMIHGSPGN